MAVLIEGLSVIIRMDRLLAAYDNEWDAFVDDVPNRTLCSDHKLARVGFMSPHDVRAFNARLGRRGLNYMRDGVAQDLVVVDQLTGPLAPCGWIEFGAVDLRDNPRITVALCRLRGCKSGNLAVPDGWRFDESLSKSPGFVPDKEFDQTLEFLRHGDGLDVYLNKKTGKEIFIGRSSGKR